MSAPAAALFRLDGRTAFVSGGAGHLGLEMVRGLAAHGAHVIVNGRDQARLDMAAASLAEENIAVSTACFDMMDHAAVARFFGGLARLDILVNNAVTVKPGRLDSVTAEAFDIAYRSSVGAAFEAMRAAKHALLGAVAETGGASVINIATMYARVSPDPRIYGESGLNSPPHYGAAKAGLVQLTRHMACEWGQLRIRVNAISPGPFPHPRLAAEQAQFAMRLAQKTPLGRTGRAGEIAGPVVFLASDAGSYVTGCDLAVDGGWTSW
jgi:NAD(P)-dependent dehydrogenase (short-subunit alcohol dehydrogenase family)